MPIVDSDAEANIFDVGFISDARNRVLVWVHMIYRRNYTDGL